MPGKSLKSWEPLDRDGPREGSWGVWKASAYTNPLICNLQQHAGHHLHGFERHWLGWRGCVTACATSAREGTERSDQPCGGTSTDILAPASRSHRGSMPPSSANSRHARPPARAGGDPERMLRRWASGDRRVREERSCYRVGRDGNGGDGGVDPRNPRGRGLGMGAAHTQAPHVGTVERSHTRNRTDGKKSRTMK